MITKSLINRIEKTYDKDHECYLVSYKLRNEYIYALGDFGVAEPIKIYRKWYQLWKPKVTTAYGYTSYCFKGIPLYVKREK